MRKENFYLWLVKFIPKRIKYWCFVNIGAYVTQGKYSKTCVPELTMMDAIKRYGDDFNL